MNPCEGIRERLTNGLREFLKIDNHRALEVGHLSEDLGSLEVRRAKESEGYPEMTVRESPDELTLRAEEVETCKSYINVDHIEKERWRGVSLVDTDWHASCQALYKGIEGEDWGEVYDAYKKYGLLGVKKPQEAQKVKGPPRMQEKNTTIPCGKTTSW